MFDAFPVPPKIKLFTIHYFFGRSNRRNQETPFHGGLKQFSLRFGSEEIPEYSLDPFVFLCWLSTIEEHHRVVKPVFVAGCLVAKSFFMNPIH